MLQSDVEALRAGGWAAWKPVGIAMSARSAYNVALPRPPPRGAKTQVPGGGGGGGASCGDLHAAAGAASWAIEVVEEGCGAEDVS